MLFYAESLLQFLNIFVNLLLFKNEHETLKTSFINQKLNQLGIANRLTVIWTK